MTILRPALLRFAQRMEMKIRKHDRDRGRVGWRRASRGDIEKWLSREIAELRVAMRRGTPTQVQDEASDVANLCMMLCDWIEEDR